VIALKMKEETARLALQKEKELFEAAEMSRRAEEERQAVAAAAAKRVEEDRTVLAAKMKTEREALQAIRREKEFKQLHIDVVTTELDVPMSTKHLSIRQQRLEKELNLVFRPQGHSGRGAEDQDRLLVAIKLVLQASEQSNERLLLQTIPPPWWTPHELLMNRVDSMK
jgi:hypothetical protein